MPYPVRVISAAVVYIIYAGLETRDISLSYSDEAESVTDEKLEIDIAQAKESWSSADKCETLQILLLNMKQLSNYGLGVQPRARALP